MISYPILSNPMVAEAEETAMGQIRISVRAGATTLVDNLAEIRNFNHEVAIILGEHNTEVGMVFEVEEVHDHSIMGLI